MTKDKDMDEKIVQNVFSTNTKISMPLRIFMVFVASVISALNLRSFVYSGGLLPGGFTGLSLLLQEIFQKFFNIAVPFAPFNLVFNFVPAVICFRFVGKKFTIFSCAMIVLVSVFTDLFPAIPVTNELILAAVFGGIINATAVSICLLAGASGGGTDFIAVWISEKFGRDSWSYIFAFNALILIVAGILFGWDAALYSIIFQFVSMQMVQLLYRRYQKVTLFVITDNPEIAYKIIHDTTNHDATEFEATGCYTQTKHTILYSVISADEARAVVRELRKADKSAFINVLRSEEILGRFYSRPKD